MTGYLNAESLSRKTGFPLWKAQRVIQTANKRIKEKGGVIRKGMAPRKVLEEMLFCDLSGAEERGGSDERD